MLQELAHRTAVVSGLPHASALQELYQLRRVQPVLEDEGRQLRAQLERYKQRTREVQSRDADLSAVLAERGNDVQQLQVGRGSVWVCGWILSAP